MANLSLKRAILWRRLARLRSGGRGEQPAAPPVAVATGAGPLPAATEAWLTPVLIDYFGRDGSTALVNLLASSPGSHVEGRYPYEAQLFAHLWRWSRSLGASHWPERDWSHGSGDPTQTTAPEPRPPSPPPWWPGSALERSGEHPAWRRAFDRAWADYSAGALAAHSPANRPSYYVEKLLDLRAIDRTQLAPTRALVLLRDPRDTWVSIEAFSQAVGAEAIGGEGPPEQRLARFIERQQERLEWIAALEPGADTLVVEYRRLVEGLPELARELGEWLDLELDVEQLPRDFRLRWVHATSSSPDRSVGRWREELDPEIAARIGDRLGPAMRALGLET